MSDPKSRIEIDARRVTREEASRIRSTLEDLPEHRRTTLHASIERRYVGRADFVSLEDPKETIRELAEKLQEKGCRGTVFYFDAENLKCWHSRVTMEGAIKYVRRVSDSW